MPARNVTVVVDSLNQLVRYSDIRGDLRGPGSAPNPDKPWGPQTGITLNAVQGFAVLRNSIAGQPGEQLRVKGASFLDAPNLGVPRRMIEHVLKECGT